MSLQRLLAKFGRTNKAKPEEVSFMKEDFTARFMQKISMPIVRIIYPFGIITPNRLTWLSYFVVILGSMILIISEGNILLLFLVGFCVWLSALIDGLDGPPSLVDLQFDLKGSDYTFVNSFYHDIVRSRFSGGFGRGYPLSEREGNLSQQED